MEKSEKGGAGGAGFPDCFIGAGVRLEGSLDCPGFLRVEGECRSGLRVGGNLVVAEGATVQGAIEAADVLVAGSVEGTVSARGKLRLAATARLKGDVEVAGFSMRRGAIFDGEVRRRKA